MGRSQSIETPNKFSSEENISHVQTPRQCRDLNLPQLPEHHTRHGREKTDGKNTHLKTPNISHSAQDERCQPEPENDPKSSGCAGEEAPLVEVCDLGDSYEAHREEHGRKGTLNRKHAQKEWEMLSEGHSQDRCAVDE